MSGPRILIIRFSALGDVVLATSLLEPLRAAHPEVHLGWVADANHAPLLQGLVDELITFDRTRRESRAAVLAQVKGRFDVAIDLQNKVFSRRVAWAAAPERKVLIKRTVTQSLRALLGRDVVLQGTPQPELYARAAGVPAPGRVTLRLSEAAQATARALMPGERWVGVAPGAAWANKRWPAERYALVAQHLASAGFRVALLGGPMDEPQLEVVRASKAISLDVSRESLEVVAAVCARVSVLIGNDSGLGHVATALGTKAVSIFGPTAPTRWAPQAPSVAVSLNLSCSPCSNHGAATCPLGHHKCMQELSVERVLAQLR